MLSKQNISIRDIIGRNPGDWPTENEENGNYRIDCFQCSAVVSGPKHAQLCNTCFKKNEEEWNALSPEEQQKRIRENIATLKELTPNL